LLWNSAYFIKSTLVSHSTWIFHVLVFNDLVQLSLKLSEKIVFSSLFMDLCYNCILMLMHIKGSSLRFQLYLREPHLILSWFSQFMYAFLLQPFFTQITKWPLLNISNLVWIDCNNDLGKGQWFCDGIMNEP